MSKEYIVKLTKEEIISIIGCESSYDYFTNYYKYEKQAHNKLRKVIEYDR